MYESGVLALMNFKASYKVKEWLTVEAGINNLLDRNYQYTDGYPEAGRNYFANLRYTF
jgi:iron complex outermembrane receptor protein